MRDVTGAELLSRVEDLHVKLGWAVCRRVTLTDILFEKLQHVNILIILRGERFVGLLSQILVLSISQDQLPHFTGLTLLSC